ncbi:MAG: hypothetical protein E7655_03325 [Ruminococcaceae bacterium]|nr:hypothetical protein [Oscillospiraceae bacterium]
MKKYVFLFCLFLLFACLTAALLPAHAEQTVVFIADGGTGDGSSPESPLGEGPEYAAFQKGAYSKSAINRAMGKLMAQGTGGTVVLCGPVTLKWGATQQDPAGTDEVGVCPDNKKTDLPFTVTSVYGGVDYRKTADAKLILQRNDKNLLSIVTKSPMTWENITLRIEHESASCVSQDNFTFFCTGYRSEFKESFAVEAYVGGVRVDEKDPANARFFPLLAGARRQDNRTMDTNLIVNGGVWQYVCGGTIGLPYGEQENSLGSLTGNTSVIFGGNAVTLEGLGGASYHDGGRLNGNTSLNITGGTLFGEIDLGGRGGFKNNDANVRLTVTGGNFKGVTAINDVNAAVKWNAPASSSIDLSALPQEQAEALLGRISYVDSVLMPDGSIRTFSAGEISLPEAVIDRLRSTPYTRAQYKAVYDSILAGEKQHSVLDLIAMLSAKPTNGAEGLDVPANTDVMRERTIDYFDRMSQMEWSTPKTLDYRTATTFTTKLVYEAGQTYTGMMYSSTRKPSTSIEEFATYLNGNKQYIGPTDYPYLMGVDCGAPRLAWAYGGALINTGLYSSDFEFMINYNDKTNKVITTVGEYDTSGYKSGSDINAYTSFDRICKPNGEKVMFEAYAQIRPCDYVVKRSKGSSSTTDQHILLAVKDAAVFRSTDGSISGVRSYLTLSEQTCTVYDVDGKKTTWRLNEKRSFNNLYTNGYIPLTLHSLKSETVEKPDLTFDKGSYSEGIDLVGRGTIKSNYVLFSVNAAITDASGKVVAEAVAYPYTCSLNLSDISKIITTPTSGADPDRTRDQGMSSFNKTAKTLPSGSYTYTLTATIGFGTKTVARFDFTR